MELLPLGFSEGLKQQTLIRPHVAQRITEALPRPTVWKKSDHIPAAHGVRDDRDTPAIQCQQIVARQEHILLYLNRSRGRFYDVIRKRLRRRYFGHMESVRKFG